MSEPNGHANANGNGSPFDVLIPEILPTDVDPNEAEHHFQRVNNRKLSWHVRWNSRIWLAEKGFIAEEAPPEPAPIERPPALPRPELRKPSGPVAREEKANAARGKDQPVSYVVNLTPAGAIPPEPVLWLWTNRIPRCALSLIIGDPGIGKSQLTIALAAAVSSGAPWPDHPHEKRAPANVVIFAAEDNLANTVVPRLIKAGADMDRVHLLTSVKSPAGRLTQFSLTRDLPGLDTQMTAIGNVALLVMDPITSYLGGSDENKSGETREALDPLVSLAEKHKTAVALINHMNKGAGQNVLYRSLGSIGMGALSRIVWYVSPHPFEDDRGLFTFVKGNLCKPQPGLSFVFRDDTFHWSDPVAWTAKQVTALMAARERDGREPGDGKRGPVADQRKAVVDAIMFALAEGPLARHELWMQVKEETEVSLATFKRALELMVTRKLVELFDVKRQQFVRLPQQLPLGGVRDENECMEASSSFEET